MIPFYLSTVLLLSLFIQVSVQANTFTFKVGPIKSLSLSSKWEEIAESATEAVWAKTLRQLSSLNDTRVTLNLYELPQSQALERIFKEPSHVLSQEEKQALAHSINLWILRYVLERGLPVTRDIKGKAILYNKFTETLKIMRRLPDGKRGCSNANEYKVHAFILEKGKLLDIALNRISSGKEPSAQEEAATAYEFESILQTIQWR